MSTPAPLSPSVLAPKPHYAALDGLRGVAAVMVVLFHMFEGSARDFQFHTDQIINHGYLSVDFFFMLSGFVIGYAYDDRWGKMSLWNFCKRRLVRLQPMVVMGMLLGGALFYFQGSEIFPNIAQTPVWKMLLVMTVGFTLLPVPVSLDIRGWTEMHPLNGPAWSLFFEYIANILYAVLIRKIHQPVAGGPGLPGGLRPHPPVLHAGQQHRRLDAGRGTVPRGIDAAHVPLLRRPAPVPPVQARPGQARLLVVQPASGGSAGHAARGRGGKLPSERPV